MKSYKWFAVMAVMMTLMTISGDAFAQEAANSYKHGVGMGAGLAIGLAAIGGALGQGLTARAALEGISRNPNAADKMNTPMLIGLVLIESLVIYALVIGYMLQGKI